MWILQLFHFKLTSTTLWQRKSNSSDVWCNILVPHRSICVVMVLHCGFEASSVGVYTHWGVRHGTISFLWSGYLLCVSGQRGVLQQIAVGPRAPISSGLLVGRASLSPVITACQRPGVWLRLYRRTQVTADSHWPKDQKASSRASLITQLYFTKRLSVCAETPQKRHRLTLLKYTIIQEYWVLLSFSSLILCIVQRINYPNH